MIINYKNSKKRIRGSFLKKINKDFLQKEEIYNNRNKEYN